MSFYNTIINLRHQQEQQEIIYNLNASHTDRNTVKLSINRNLKGFQDVNEKQEPMRTDTYVQEQDTQEIEIIDPLTYCCDASTKNVINAVYFCDFCYANFKSNTECELHKKICNNDNFVNDVNTEIITPSPAPATNKNNNISLNCEYCDLQFKREYWYKKHLEKLHKPLVIENYNISSPDSKTLADNDKTSNTNSSISIHNIISETKTIFHKSIQSQTKILHKFADVIQDKINHQNSLFLKQKCLFNNNVDECQIRSIKETLEKQYTDIQFQKQLLNDIFSTLKKETNEIESFITGLMKAIKKSNPFIDINLITGNNNNNSLNDSVENVESKENEEILTLHNINVEEINLNNSDIEIIDILQKYSINSNNINKEMILTNGNKDHINNNAIDSSVDQQNNIYIESANATANEVQNYSVSSDTDARDMENCIDSIDKNKSLNNITKIIRNTKSNKKSSSKQIIKFNKPNNKKDNIGNATEYTFSNANKQNLISNENASIPNESDAIPNQSCSTNEKNKIGNVQLKYTQLSIDNIIYTVQQNVDKTFRCTLCKVSFKNLCSLKPHILRVHTKQKTKSCPHCKRAFATTGDLTRHIRIHTGDRPFKCKYLNCKFEFISSGDLYKHARRHINIRNKITNIV